jgi:hypothetical protein
MEEHFKSQISEASRPFMEKCIQSDKESSVALEEYHIVDQDNSEN